MVVVTVQKEKKVKKKRKATYKYVTYTLYDDDHGDDVPSHNSGSTFGKS